MQPVSRNRFCGDRNRRDAPRTATPLAARQGCCARAGVYLGAMVQWPGRPEREQSAQRASADDRSGSAVPLGWTIVWRKLARVVGGVGLHVIVLEGPDRRTAVLTFPPGS
jgi:hypothetical protein